METCRERAKEIQKAENVGCDGIPTMDWKLWIKWFYAFLTPDRIVICLANKTVEGTDFTLQWSCVSNSMIHECPSLIPLHFSLFSIVFWFGWNSLSMRFLKWFSRNMIWPPNIEWYVVRNAYKCVSIIYKHWANCMPCVCVCAMNVCFCWLHRIDSIWYKCTFNLSSLWSPYYIFRAASFYLAHHIDIPISTWFDFCLAFSCQAL